jgi:immunoglobulin-like protein involved in spore germination/sporulation and spore germination protein
VIRLALVLAALALVAGCAGGDDDAAEGETTTAPAETAELRVYFLHEGKVWPVLREVDTTGGEATGALTALLEGPTRQEEGDLDLTTAIPETTEGAEVSVEDGVAAVQLDVELEDAGLAQVVYTLSQFPEVERVEVQERFLTRGDFEEQTPAILVESPLAFEDVASPLRVTGTANTFEANFEYELTDTDGKIVDESFVTATSGTGTRGTFDFTTDPYTVPFDGVGALIVFERSAEDGSRMNLVEIPLRMTR